MALGALAPGCACDGRSSAVSSRETAAAPTTHRSASGVPGVNPSITSAGRSFSSMITSLATPLRDDQMESLINRCTCVRVSDVHIDCPSIVAFPIDLYTTVLKTLTMRRLGNRLPGRAATTPFCFSMCEMSTNDQKGMHADPIESVAILGRNRRGALTGRRWPSRGRRCRPGAPPETPVTRPEIN